MQHLEVSGPIRYIYIYIYVIRRLKVNPIFGNLVLYVFGCCRSIRNFYFGIVRGQLFFKTCSVEIYVSIIIVQFSLKVFVFMDATVTGIIKL